MEYKDLKYTPISCTVACNNLKRKFPYQWDLNIYRGCAHGCKYCFAIYTHKYMESQNFYDDIFVKTNIMEFLEKQLSSKSWKREIVNLGGITDNYQTGEEEYKLMPEILKLLIKYKTPAIISTKSDLILRDFNLIDELSHITYVNVACSIITTDEDLRKKLEPGSSTAKRRFNVLREFKKTNASTGLHFMPIIPYLTDSYESIESLFEKAKECEVSYVLPGVLYLRGQTRPKFLEFIASDFPDIYESFISLYRTGSANKTYKEELYERVNFLRDKYSLSKSYSKPMKEKMLQDEILLGQQLSLFDQ